MLHTNISIMCIVCVKKAGVEKPNKELITTMAYNNPQGFGMSIARNGKLVSYHSMKVEDIIALNKKIKKSDSVIYHFRIATHGSVSLKNCHPFLSVDKQWAFAHNGIISIKNEGDWTDSYTFFVRVIQPLIKGGFAPGSKEFDSMMGLFCSSNKMALMDKDGNCSLYGAFVDDNEYGLSFSNYTYESYKTKVYSPMYSPYTSKYPSYSKYGKYAGKYDDHYEDDYDDPYYSSSYYKGYDNSKNVDFLPKKKDDEGKEGKKAV